jgi:Arc/MetJ-type ribon-helix-helix transcriptional regulator
MSAISVRLPDSLHKAVRELAKQDMFQSTSLSRLH